MKWELPDVQAGFRKDRGVRDQIASIHWITEKAREFQKNVYFCFTNYAKAFVWMTTNGGKFLKRWEYQTTSWETLCAGQEATVKTRHGKMDWFKLRKEYIKAVYCHPVINLYVLLCIGEGHGNPLQCSCLESPRDRVAWWAAFYGVTQSRTRLKRLSSSSRVHQATCRAGWSKSWDRDFWEKYQ